MIQLGVLIESTSRHYGLRTGLAASRASEISCQNQDSPRYVQSVFMGGEEEEEEEEECLGNCGGFPQSSVP